MSILTRNNVTVTGTGTPDPHLRPWVRLRPAYVALCRARLRRPLPRRPVRSRGRGRLRPLGLSTPTSMPRWRAMPPIVLEICAALDLRRRHLRRPLGERHDRRAGGHRGARAVRASWCWSAPPPAISTTAPTSAGSPGRISTSCSTRWTATTWAGRSAMAPVIMGNPEHPELAAELTESFCRTDPAIARQFARVTFLSDNRADLPLVRTPALILQCAEDVIAPPEVGAYVHRHLRRQSPGHAQRHGALPPSECARGDHRRHAAVLGCAMTDDASSAADCRQRRRRSCTRAPTISTSTPRAAISPRRPTA